MTAKLSLEAQQVKSIMRILTRVEATRTGRKPVVSAMVYRSALAAVTNMAVFTQLHLAQGSRAFMDMCLVDTARPTLTDKDAESIANHIFYNDLQWNEGTILLVAKQMGYSQKLTSIDIDQVYNYQ